MSANYVEGVNALTVIAAALAEEREVNGGELESVLTIFRPEGLAIIVLNRLTAAGYEVVRMSTVGGSDD